MFHAGSKLFKHLPVSDVCSFLNLSLPKAIPFPQCSRFFMVMIKVSDMLSSQNLHFTNSTLLTGFAR
jgi:hypothetical protein